MGVQVGDNNRIKKTVIAEEIRIDDKGAANKTFYNRHPVICGFLVSLVAGILLLFSFWEELITFLERLV